MKRSTERILTTHTGSLPRPRAMLDLLLLQQRGQLEDETALLRSVRDAVGDTVAQQLACGLDVINDGEMGRVDYTVFVKNLLTGFNNETLDFEGKYYNYSGIKLWLKPYQKPYPPLWYPTANIEMIPWVAEAGMNTCGIIEPSRGYKEHYDLYKRLWAENKDKPDRINGHVAEPKIGMARPVYVADSDDEALDRARVAHGVWRTHIGFLFDLAGITIEPLERLSDFDEQIREETFVVGSPQTVADKIARTVEDCGINYFNGLFTFGDFTHQEVMRSVELFAGEVMPAFR